MKKAYLIALTMALLCVPSMQAWADENDPDDGWGNYVYYEDHTDYTYDEYSFDYDYDDKYVPAWDGSPCPPATELVEYASPVRLLRVISFRGANIKNAPQEDGAVIGDMYYGEVMRLEDDSDEAWYHVKYDGQDGYVNKKAGVRVEETYRIQPGIDNRRATVEYAMGFLGGKYAFGGRSREAGYDCSGLVRTILQDSAGISIGYSSKEQAKQGTPIDITEIKPGDLVFYGTSEETINHVAMYIGNGRIIQAQSTGHGITIKPWNEPANFLRAVRFFPE